MNFYTAAGSFLIAGQVGWYLYSAEWIPMPLLALTGTRPGEDWESWHGLRDVLSYIPISGVLLLCGAVQAIFDEDDRQSAERAQQHRDWLAGRGERP